MRILLIIDSLVAGGRERRLIELIKGFKHYHDVELKLIVFSDKIHYKEVYNLGLPITILKRVPKQNPIIFFRVFQQCKEWEPDLIHSWGTMSTLLAIPTSVLLKIRIINGNIVNAPSDMNFFDKRLIRARLTYPFSRVVVGNSVAGLRAYQVPAHKALCIYNGFDKKRITSLKSKESIRNKYKIFSNDVIGMVGSFSDRKDFETFIKAGLLILKNNKDVSFVLVGDGPNMKKCIQLIPEDFKSNFIFTGIQRDVESIVNVFSIGVLSTNTTVHGEGISNAILEYMALGKPVVATTGGGTNEVVEHNKTGYLIPAHSPLLMAEKLEYLLNNEYISTTFGKNGKARLNSFFSLDKMTQIYYELYKKHLNYMYV